LYDCEFPENLQWKQNFTNMCQWIHICTHQVFCLMWVKCTIRNLNIIVLSICEFHKNQHKDGHAFLTGVHKITFMFMSAAFSAFSPNPHNSTYTPQTADAWQQVICNVTTVQSLSVWTGYHNFPLQKYNATFTTFFRNNHSRNTVGQDQELRAWCSETTFQETMHTIQFYIFLYTWLFENGKLWKNDAYGNNRQRVPCASNDTQHF
jgi:hypothetical protein